MATMTLAQAARQMEESGTQIKVGNFDSFDQFMSYFGLHYKPLLEAISGGVALDDKQRRLLNFFCDDMQAAFSEETPAEDDGIADPADTTPADDPAQEVYAEYSKKDEIIDLLEAYGADHDLPEGWWEEECDLDDIVLLINFEN